MNTKVSNQFTNTVLAIEPTSFYFNKEAKTDNVYMHEVPLTHEESQEKASVLHEGFRNTLIDAGVNVMHYKQRRGDAPDAVFPDWFTTHKNEDIPGGVFILYPMFHKSRRNERDPTIIEDLKKKYKYFIDLREFEAEDKALEGKGSLVFDYRNKKIFCSRSTRAHQEPLDALLEEFNKISKSQYKLVTWMSQDSESNLIYHTDCMFTVFRRHVVTCLDAIIDETDRQNLVSELTDSEKNPNGGYEIVNLAQHEAANMCANVFCLLNKDGEDVLIMSARAERSYRKENIDLLRDQYKVAVANVDLMEYIAGGSTRCMLAEIF